MTINEIVKLPKTKDSIIRIESFIALNENDINTIEARLFLANVYFHINEYNEAIKNLLLLKNNYSFDVRAIDGLYMIYMHLKDYQQALKIIKEKKAICDKLLWMPQMIQLHYQMNNYIEAYALAIILIEEEIDDQIRIETYQLLIKISLKNRQYDDAFKYIKMYRDFIVSIGLSSYNGIIYESIALYHLEKYVDADNLMNDVMRYYELIDESLKYQAVLIKLKIFMAKKEYRYASIFEAEFETVMEKASLDERLEFYTICYNLYDLLKNYHSKELYFKKLNLINIYYQPLVSKKKIIRKSKENLHYQIIDQIGSFIECFQSDILETQTRDILLNGLKNANKFIHFEEVIYFNISDQISGFHYKKERLYDKEILIIEETVVSDMLEKKDEILYTSINRLVRKKEIITGQYYEELDIKCVFVFPIFRQKRIVGGMIFYGYDYQMLKGHNYELLKLLKNILADKINDNNIILSNLKRVEMYVCVFDNIDAYIKYQINDLIFVNRKMQNDFDLPRQMNNLEYLSHIEYTNVSKYKTFNDNQDETLSYRFCEKNIFETRKFNKNAKISLLENYDLIVKKQKQENELIFVDSLTKLRNRYAYQIDVLECIRHEKFSVIYIDIDKFKDLNDCYGHMFGDSILRLFAQILQDFFVPYQAKIYRITSDEFLIILDKQNDIRKVSKLMTELIEYVSYQLNKQYPRINLSISAGVLRYKAQLLEKMPEKILRYVDFAMYQAKNNKVLNESNYHFFDKEKYKEYLLSQQIVTHINEEIDQSKIGLLYHQVMNLDGYKVLHYEVSPHIYDLEIPKEEIMRIITLRGLKTKLERFMIKKSLIEMNNVYKKTKKFFRISLQISYETITAIDFFSFISEILQKNQYPKEMITFDLYGDFQPCEKILEQLRSLSILIITDDLVNMLRFDIDYLKISFLTDYLDDVKGQKTLAHILSLTKDLNIKLIINNLLDKKQIELLNKLGIKYIHYGKQIFLEDIIKKLGEAND